MKKVEIFWSGGIDSTYRITELSRSDIEIQPYYIKNVNWRKSEDRELSAISEITELLRADSRTKAKLNDLIIVGNNPKDREVTIAYRKIYTRLLLEARERGENLRPDNLLNHVNSKEFITSQWQVFGAFAKNHIGIETAFSGQDDFATLALIGHYGVLKEQVESYGKYWIFIPHEAKSDMYPIMGNIRITALEFKTKVDKINKLLSDNYDDVLNKTWFCYDPINNEPCGHCFPCIQIIRAGITDRFSADALARYDDKADELKRGN